jgi:hypothetical protein
LNKIKYLRIAGGVAIALAALCTVADVCIGTALGGDLSQLPQTAAGRFAQFRENQWLGLYSLDMLNAVIAVLMILPYFAVLTSHRGANDHWVKLGVIVFLIGTAVFIANNAALPMLDLSIRHAASATETQKSLLEAAGESLLARGAHGRPGVFPAFILSGIANLVLSVGMLKGRIFNKANAYAGIVGSLLLLIYLILVTFVPGTKTIAVLLAAPGGLLSIAWMIMTAIGLFRPLSPERA